MAFTTPYALGSYGGGQGEGGLSLEDLLNDPDFLAALSKAGAGGDIGTAMPEGMHVGGTYVAPHPLQYVAAIGQKIAGGLNQRKLNDAMARLLRGRSRPQPQVGSEFDYRPEDLYEGT